MIASLVPLLVAVAFLAAIVAVWLSKPIFKGKLVHGVSFDTSYYCRAAEHPEATRLKAAHGARPR